MTGTLALVGRPNVGKSTLFNRLTRSRDALVADLPGLTRDRQYGTAELAGRRLVLIDTGGLSGEEVGIDSAMAQQTLQAVDEADRVLFLVDGRAGLTAGDELIAEQLRRMGREAHLVVNKVDGVGDDAALAEFASLGFGEPLPISAAHGRGLRALEDTIGNLFPDALTEEEEAARGLVVSVVGRPNVGKSTLINRMLGEERVVVFDQAGTTRDSIFIPYERDGQRYTLVDTAGVRRRGKVSDTVEKFSIVKTLAAIDAAGVVVLLIDAREGLVEQDLHLLGTVLEYGRAVVLAVNKWDGMTPDDRARVKDTLGRRLNFIPWLRIHFISAMHGTGVGTLYGAVAEAWDSAMRKMPTPKLTAVLESAVQEHAPPLHQGRRIKLRYAHQGGHRPPRIIIHGNQTEHLSQAYIRFLEKRFREHFKLVGTPLVVGFKGSENPFAGRRNTLTPRQQRKRQRLMKHIKKNKR